MATLTTNPYTAEKEAIAFPCLDDEQITSLTAHGTTRLCRDGEVLFRAGDRAFSFFVVKHGRIRIVERKDGDELLIAAHEPGEFTGDVDMITGRPSIVTAVCEGCTDVVEIHPEDLRRIVAEQSELGEIILRAFLMRRQMIQEQGFTGTRLIGSRWSRDVFRLKDFLSRNQVVFTWIDLESDPDVDQVLQRFGVRPEETPVVICPNGALLKNPTEREVADCLGLRPQVRRQATYDLVVVGAGPAGLAAAVYAASEGLSTLVVEGTAPGGQAGTSSKIENYLGFPTGVSGSDLTRRATIQAQKFGATIASPQRVVAVGCDRGLKRLDFDTGESVLARCMVVATGAEYRKLTCDGYGQFEGSGVFYGATPVEAIPCRGEEVIVVGGGNSAGQAAVFLSGYAKKVTVIIRRDSLTDTMSRYLINRIQTTPNIELLTRCEITAMRGDGALEAVTVRRGSSQETRNARAVFAMIGADPRTDWLAGCLVLDDKGFILTGHEARRHPRFAEHWTLPREPFFLETSRPGVLAAGDVRSGSIKRVASAVGEGSMAIKYVHEFLAS